ncbi:MAG: hypothetical protein J1F39_03300 [Clostridiales bacterium]|nr:hypothetical protein [Clostridiales bacterium]
MKYLFFDIECANCFNGIAKICEFGYVLTDESFNVIQKEIFLINPNDKFDWYVAKKLLNYSINSYRRSPLYTHYFDRIKALFTDEDTMIFGHTVDSDFKFLNDEARRYSLPFFDCRFYDAKYMYDTYAKTESAGDGNSLSVSKICVALGIELPELVHKSVDDAYATMLIVKELTKRMNVDVNGLIALCADCKGETSGGEIKTVITERARQKRAATANSNYMKGVNKSRFYRFLNGVKPQGTVRINELTGKKICFSLNYERDHFRQTLSLVQLLKNCGCIYKRPIAQLDYFMSYKAYDDDGNEIICPRLSAVECAAEQGASIKVIPFESLLRILGVTEDELNAMPFPDESSFAKRPSRTSKRERGENPNGKAPPTTIGETLKARGVDLSARK